ncbi:hypothetical protein [Mangrovivirga cuniculi]|uniref:Uncharacterized protein n=1 Tax=Mangrovivirga cuniculi TaxID=2715131 RepID=A0A4D7JNN8_9BACT|nr:hypothetical protein [Mangrovivirga cuniculi]QCK16287.1 hypothetical protein DCC35_16850 [Mangrovivirga cuniculi]
MNILYVLAFFGFFQNNNDVIERYIKHLESKDQFTLSDLQSDKELLSILDKRYTDYPSEVDSVVITVFNNTSQKIKEAKRNNQNISILNFEEVKNAFPEYEVLHKEEAAEVYFITANNQIVSTLMINNNKICSVMIMSKGESYKSFIF